MSRPRPVFRGKTYMVTRRCAGRKFFLKPTRAVNRVVLYCVARASELFGVEIHAACFLSNHFHLIVTDRKGRLPDFMHWLDSMLARALNAHYGRSENFFASGTYSRVELVGLEDVLSKIVYVLTNPVSAALVPRGRDWPGVWLGPLAHVAAVRPGYFFRSTGDNDDDAVATLSLTKPPSFIGTTDAGFKELIRGLVENREEAIAEELREKRRRFLGKRGVLAQPPFDSPASREPRRKLNPRIAARDKWRRIEALRALGSFVEAYRDALARFREGMRDVVFPAGTWLVRLRYGARCAEP